MDRAAKARQAKLNKLATEWEQRLERMGMGERSSRDHNDSIVYNGQRHSRDYTPAPVPDLSHMDPEVAAVFAEETGAFESGRRMFDPSSRQSVPVMRRATPAEPKRFWPNAEETHVNYRNHASLIGNTKQGRYA